MPQWNGVHLPQGEASKSLKVYGQVLQAMLEFNMTRKDLLVAVGGGVVGDLAGSARHLICAALILSTAPPPPFPQIDSSIGGKTAIDLGETKNIVGAFWQPKVVLVDFDAPGNAAPPPLLSTAWRRPSRRV